MTFENFSKLLGKSKEDLHKVVYAKKGTANYERSREFGVIRPTSKTFIWRGKIYKASSFARFIYQLNED